MIQSILAISLGASCGAILRWIAVMAFNQTHAFLPLGTLLVNLAGGYLIGLAVSFFAAFPALGPQWSLAVITGFLGSLTTFSSFSQEVTALIQQGHLLWAGGLISLHVAGSLLMTFLGMGTFVLIRSLSS